MIYLFYVLYEWMSMETVKKEKWQKSSYRGNYFINIYHLDFISYIFILA